MVVINQNNNNYTIDASYLACGDNFMSTWSSSGNYRLNKWTMRIPKEKFNRNVTRERLSNYFLFLKDLSITVKENEKSWSVTTNHLYLFRFAFKLIRYMRGGIPLDIFDNIAKEMNNGASFSEALLICTLVSDASREYEKKGSYIMHMDILYTPDYWYEVITTKQLNNHFKKANNINGAMPYKTHIMTIDNVKPDTFRNRLKKVYKADGFKTALKMYKDKVKF